MATFVNVYEGPVTATRRATPSRAAAVVIHCSPAPDATLDMTVALTTTGTVRGHFFRADGTTPIPFGSVKLIANG